MAVPHGLPSHIRPRLVCLLPHHHFAHYTECYCESTALRQAGVTLSAENVTNKDYWSSAVLGYLTMGAPRTFKSSITFEY